MISKYIKFILPFLIAASVFLSGCTSSTGSTTDATEVHVHITHEPADAVTITGSLGKQFDYVGGNTIELATAYLTISEMDLRSDCGVSPFVYMFDSILNVIVPTANAHTESAPTLIGEPLVLNIMSDDTVEVEFGDFSPAAGDYCGVTVHMHTDDGDARDRPTTPDMTGLVAFLDGTYDTGFATGTFTVNLLVELEHADIVFPDVITLSQSNLTGGVELNIEYDTWFDGVDMDLLTAGNAIEMAAETAKLEENIRVSIEHHSHI